MRIIAEFTVERGSEETIALINAAGGQVPAGVDPVPMRGKPPTIAIPIEAEPSRLDAIKALPGFLRLYSDARIEPMGL